jgi:hypothetical protein
MLACCEPFTGKTKKSAGLATGAEASNENNIA